MTIEHTLPFEALGFSGIFRDYVQGDDALRARFNGDPFDPKAGLAMADRLAKREYPRHELIERLADYNQGLGAGEATLRNIDLLKKPYSFVVCTGQQAGLLTGPLYTIYKALTAIRTARKFTEAARAAGDDDRCFVPVFWCASEDHDLEEINHVFIPAGDEPKRFALDLRNDDGRAAESIRVDKSIRNVYREIVRALPKSDFKHDILRLFEPRDGDTLGSWCNRILLNLFTDEGLVALEPHLIRDLGSDVLVKELSTWQDSSACLQKGADALESLGHAASFDPTPRPHCFYLDGERRARVKTYADTVILGGTMVGARELQHHLEQDAERFSPDGALRPVVQSSILPVVAYVAGPGEIAYYSQLKEFHEHFDVPMPLVVPRASITIVEGVVARGMAKFGVSYPELFAGPEAQASKIETPGEGEALGREMDDLIADSEKRLAKMAEHAEALDAGVGKVVRKVSARIDKDLGYIKKRITGAVEEAAGVGARQLNRIFSQTWPKERPQERVYNILPYLVKYGTELTRGMMLHTPTDAREHVLYAMHGLGPFVPETPETPETADDSEGAEAAETADPPAASEPAADDAAAAKPRRTKKKASKTAKKKTSSGKKRSTAKAADSAKDDEPTDEPIDVFSVEETTDE